MFTFIVVCIVIVCVLLTLIVLVQNSKGGGLASSFASSNQIMGVKKTADFLERATWGLAIILFVLCLSATAVQPSIGEGQEEENIGTQMQEDVKSSSKTKADTISIDKSKINNKSKADKTTTEK